MFVEVKKLVETKFVDIEPKDYIGSSIIDYMCASSFPVVAAIRNDKEEIQLIVSNQEKYVEQYKNKPCSVYAPYLKILFQESPVVVQMIIETFKDSSLVRIEVKEPM